MKYDGLDWFSLDLIGMKWEAMGMKREKEQERKVKRVNNSQRIGLDDENEMHYDQSLESLLVSLSLAHSHVGPPIRPALK